MARVSSLDLFAELRVETKKPTKRAQSESDQVFWVNNRLGNDPISSR